MSVFYVKPGSSAPSIGPGSRTSVPRSTRSPIEITRSSLDRARREPLAHENNVLAEHVELIGERQGHPDAVDLLLDSVEPLEQFRPLLRRRLLQHAPFHRHPLAVAPANAP